MYEKKINRRYLIEILGTLFLYVIVLILSNSVGYFMPKGIGRTLILVSPMFPFLLMVWAVVRQVRRLDEYLRLQTLENIVIAAAVTAGWTFTYGFLEIAGFPLLSMFTVWPVMGAVWGSIAIVRFWLNR